MPKKLIKRLFPSHKVIKESKALRCFGTLLHDPSLWHLNRRSVSGAFFVGLMVAFIPIPFQMVLAAGIAIVMRVNILISATLVWISNPVTIPLLFYIAYKIGAIILNQPIEDVSFELSAEWLKTQFILIWEPFLLGCFILGMSSAIIGYIGMRLYWRHYVIKMWRKRCKRRALNQQIHQNPPKQSDTD